MGVLQRELERSFEKLPEVALRNILKRKLKEAGRRLPRPAFNALVRHLLDGKDEEFEWDGPDNGELHLVFDDYDLAEVDAFQRAFEEELPDIITRLATKSGRDLFHSLSDRWTTQGAEFRAADEGFRVRLRLRWGEGLDLLGMLLTCCREIAAEEHRRRLRSRKARADPRVFVLFRLHARACQVANEILCLMENGFADGAMARWRTLHELAVIAAVIEVGDDDLAQRYIDHDAVDLKRQADDYDAAHENPISPQKRAAINAGYDAALDRYGKAFGGSNGWAAHHLGKERPTFRDLQDEAGRSSMNPYFKLASFSIHAGSRSMFSRLTTLDPGAGPGAGRSNAGLLQPGMNTAFSLMQITAAVLPVPADLDRQIEMTSILEIRDRVAPALRKADRQLRRDEQAHQKAKPEEATRRRLAKTKPKSKPKS